MVLKKHLAADGAAAMEKRQADDPGVIHLPPSDDAMALKRRLPADNVKFPLPIGPPHIDGKVKAPLRPQKVILGGHGLMTMEIRSTSRMRREVRGVRGVGISSRERRRGVCEVRAGRGVCMRN